MKNSTELLRFIARLANAILKALADGKIRPNDAKHFLRLLPVIRPAFDDIGDAWDEFRLMNDDDKEAFRHVISDELELNPDDTRAQKLSELAVNAALSLTEFIVNLKKLTE
jgi:hypothetical protein